MTAIADKLPELVRRRIDSLGEAGRLWSEGLDELVSSLQQRWQFDSGDILEGGSEALVMTVTSNKREPLILKIKLPGELDNETSVLRMADGRGYAKLIDHDQTSGAMLLERLGNKLAEVESDPVAQMKTIVTTMKSAWVPFNGQNQYELTTGSEKARWLKHFIAEMAERTYRPLTTNTLNKALEVCEECADSFNPSRAVLVHGDAHAENTLLIGNALDEGCKFIDPDGLFAEKATDLATIMRNGNAELLSGAPRRDLMKRAETLAEMTDEDPEAIWHWGFIERVSTGLLLKHMELDKEAAQYLKVAELTYSY